MKLVTLVFTVLFFASCSEEIQRAEKPSDLLPREKMVKVIEDLTKLESHIQNKYKVITDYHQVMINSGDSLLKQHGISREQFERSMDYYGTHHKEMESIYEEALNSLNKELGELESK